MNTYQRLLNGLERRGLAPAYSGWLALGLAIFFFGAATNTMAGWLYVISGIMLALIAIAVTLPRRSLKTIRLRRLPLEPVRAGDPLTVELTLENRTPRPVALILAEDLLPASLGASARSAIEQIPAEGSYQWSYTYPTQRRGIYTWQTVRLKTAAPLGLFWYRRDQTLPARAVVHPQVLPLAQCPLVDELGQDSSLRLQGVQVPQGATQGVTRTLRPYRSGDPIRLIHWRTSARYGELRVRELEIFTGGQDMVVCLDATGNWAEEAFEQAVIAAATLYFYALRQGLSVTVWTPESGRIRGDRPVLEALAEIQVGHPAQAQQPPTGIPLLWLSHSAESLTGLPVGSRWLLWAASGGGRSPTSTIPGKVIQPDQPLQSQLQSALPGVRALTDQSTPGSLPN